MMWINIHTMDQYSSNLTVLILVSMIWHRIGPIISDIINIQQRGIDIKEKNLRENSFLKRVISVIYRSYNDDNNSKIITMLHDNELKWITFNPICIILLCFNVYNAYTGDQCTIISNWFEFNFMTIYFSIIILFMQCILVISLSNHYIMYFIGIF